MLKVHDVISKTFYHQFRFGSTFY